MKQKTLALQQIYREGAARLEEAGIHDAALDAWLLLSYVTGISRADYYGHPERTVSEDETERYFTCIGRRSQRIPLQHITGEQEFMGYSFLVNEHVLIPRQDTEILVEEALKLLKPGMRILDLCTGSGCILLSLLKRAGELKAGSRQEDSYKGIEGIGTDISGDALAVAAKNAERLGVRADFIESDLFEKVEGRFDMLLSNPPYIPTEVIGGLQDEVRLYDPYIALDGKEDGLYFYREIIRDSINYMKKGSYLLFEIGCEQGEAVSALMENAGYGDICVKKDLAGLDRIVAGRYNGK